MMLLTRCSHTCVKRPARLCLLLALAGSRCATAPIDAPDTSLTSLVPASETLAAKQGLLRVEDGALVNSAAPEPCVSLLPGFQATDLDIEAEVEFSDRGAPGLVFGATVVDATIQSMYVLALHAQGVTLWRLDRFGWAPVESHVFAVEPNVCHKLRARAVADKIAVAYEGEQLFVATDTFLNTPGQAGVRAVEGLCRFHALRVRSLD
ncbi:MAG: hypothetical protein IT365_09290 [Candidatus Hydrogenedentes bacterium]|nr:hypothetical protein [Candidatus Hydrogenedentota bacterium]